MKKMTYVFLLVTALLPIGAKGQDVQPQEREAGVYANLFRFSFLPGKSDEGSELLKSALLPAFRQAEINVTMMEDLMANRDILLLIELEDGPGYYAFLVPKQDIKLWNALVDVHGTPEKAEEQVDRFIQLLTGQSQTLVFIPEHK